MSEKVKLQCPENVNSVNVGGEQYDADDNGCIEVNASSDFSMLLGAGFSLAKEKTKPKDKSKEGDK